MSAGHGCCAAQRVSTLNSALSSLGPPLEEQARVDMIRGCLHSVMAVLPEPEGQDGGQEVSPRAPSHVPASWGAAGRPLWVAGTLKVVPHLLPVPLPGHHARP